MLTAWSLEHRVINPLSLDAAPFLPSSSCFPTSVIPLSLFGSPVIATTDCWRGRVSLTTGATTGQLRDVQSDAS